MALSDFGADARRQRNERAEAGKSNFNAERTRYISREFLGWVCYAGRVTAGEFTGQRVGVVADETTADRWLQGDDTVVWDIPADPFGNLRG